jgi:hypothetical protein
MHHYLCAVGAAGVGGGRRAWLIEQAPRSKPVASAFGGVAFVPEFVTLAFIELCGVANGPASTVTRE